MKFVRKLAIRWIEHLLVLGLSVMGLMVFANVVLRYAFNSGIAVTEEVSRFVFVWLTFLGAVVAMAEGLHLGVESLVKALPRPINIACQIISRILMLGCCAVFLKGSWTQTVLNIDNVAALSGTSVALMYGAGIFASIALGSIILYQLWTVIKGISGNKNHPGESTVGGA